MILTAALLGLAAVSAFADVGMYIKGALGYGYRSRGWETTVESTAYSQTITTDFDTSSNLFVIIPTFGIEPWRGSSNVFLRGLSFEISLDVGFGKSSAAEEGYTEDFGTSFVIDPRIMAVYTHRIGRVAPYAGLGFSVPIVIIPELGGDTYNSSYDFMSVETPGVKVGFNGNIMAGVGFEVTPSIMPVIEVDFGFGTGIRVDARAGIVYRLGM